MARQRIELSSSSIVVVVVVVLGYIYIWGRVIYGLANDKWGFDFLSLSHTACQHVAGAFPAGRNQTGATADRVRTNSGRIPSESHDFI